MQLEEKIKIKIPMRSEGLGNGLMLESTHLVEGRCWLVNFAARSLCTDDLKM